MAKRRRKDGEATRAQIIETAGALIATQGFAHTTSKSIAEKAGVDLATINYHFGGRDGLYKILLAEGHRYFIDITELAALAESDIEPRQKLAGFLEQIIKKLMKEQGWQAQLFLRELLAPSKGSVEILQTVITPKTLYMQKIIHQITKIPQDDPLIQRCMMNVMAPCLVLLVSGSGTPNFIKNMVDISSVQEIVTHHQRFSLAGLDAVSKAYHDRKE